MPNAHHHALLCHPALAGDSPCTVTASATLAPDGSLRLEYQLRGTDILIPARQTPGQADGLWQHTCCEAFVAAGEAPEYREFNFSPSGQWAAYRFTEYRERDMQFCAADVPRIDFAASADAFRLTASLPATLLPSANELQISLTCVVEGVDQGKTYWALAHCSPQPDFHLRPSFTLTLKVPKP